MAKKRQISLRADNQMVEVLAKIAKDEDRTLSNVVYIILRDALKNRGLYYDSQDHQDISAAPL